MIVYLCFMCADLIKKWSLLIFFFCPTSEKNKKSRETKARYAVKFIHFHVYFIRYFQQWGYFQLFSTCHKHKSEFFSAYRLITKLGNGLLQQPAVCCSICFCILLTDIRELELKRLKEKRKRRSGDNITIGFSSFFVVSYFLNLILEDRDITAWNVYDI